MKIWKKVLDMRIRKDISDQKSIWFYAKEDNYGTTILCESLWKSIRRKIFVWYL